MESSWRTEGCGKTFKIGNDKFNVIVCQFGATLVSVNYASNDDKAKEMTLNYPPVREPGHFRNDEKHIYFGVTNGRVAGRIAKGKFNLPNGKQY
jgi:galactose mutarotase-like enzyme